MDKLSEPPSSLTKVAVLPIPTEAGGVSYHAVAGETHSQGTTPGRSSTP